MSDTDHEELARRAGWSEAGGAFTGKVTRPAMPSETPDFHFLGDNILADDWEAACKRDKAAFDSLRLPNGEFLVKGWKCPGCGHVQDDSVHPVDGPFFTCICGECGKDFQDSDLDQQSLASWNAARFAAEGRANV